MADTSTKTRILAECIAILADASPAELLISSGYLQGIKGRRGIEFDEYTPQAYERKGGRKAAELIPASTATLRHHSIHNQ